MNLSNYPPGVTGNEFEIAGPDAEWDEMQTCTNTVQATIPQGGVYSDSSVMEDVERECGFEGEVSCWSYQGVMHWECPDCGHEYEEDLNDNR